MYTVTLEKIDITILKKREIENKLLITTVKKRENSNKLIFKTKAQFKRRISHVPNQIDNWVDSN